MQVVSSAVLRWCHITEKRDWQLQQKSAKVVTNDWRLCHSWTAGEVSLKLKGKPRLLRRSVLLLLRNKQTYMQVSYSLGVFCHPVFFLPRPGA